MTSTSIPLTTLRDRLASVPDPGLVAGAAITDAIDATTRYLNSDAALRSLDVDSYWPKWDSPWWHMVLLHEVGEARRIPTRTAMKMVERLDALPVKIFPIEPDELPQGVDPARGTQCHCGLGNMYQVLLAHGVDIDGALPWIEPWFRRYQMDDGGLNCDELAYRQPGECPSSMVATIAPFEAMLARGSITAWTPEQRGFLDRAAGMLLSRELRRGSATAFNAEEREREPAWLKTCFPRFYFYDVLRGLAAVVRWAEASGGTLSWGAISAVVEHLLASSPDGIVRRGRRGYEGVMTRLRGPDGEWVRRQPATVFPLLATTSEVGQPCAFTTKQWMETRAGLLRLIDAGRLQTEG